MADTRTLHDGFLDELRDTYDAERQLMKALDRLAKAASSPDLREAFETHLDETRGHVDRLERVFESVDAKPRRKHCEGIAGIIEGFVSPTDLPVPFKFLIGASLFVLLTLYLLVPGRRSQAMLLTSQSSNHFPPLPHSGTLPTQPSLARHSIGMPSL